MAIVSAQLRDYYLAYLGRPRDAYAQYGSGDSMQSPGLGRAFFGSAEFGPSTDVPALIEAAYQRLFNRGAEPAAQAYWAAEVASGRLGLADLPIGLLQGAQNTDRTTVANKLQAAAAFEAALDTQLENTYYSGTAAGNSARSWLLAVSNDPASVTAAVAGAQVAMSAAAALGQPPGRPFELTTGADTIDGSVNTTASSSLFVASTGSDFFRAPQGTLDASDRLDGGGGSDTLIFLGGGNLDTTGLRVSGIEQVWLDGARAVVNLAGIAGLTTVGMHVHGAMVLRGLNSAVSLAVQAYEGADLSVEFADRDAAGTTTATLARVDQITGQAATIHLPGVESLVLQASSAGLVLDVPQMRTLNLDFTTNYTGNPRFTGLGSALQVNATGQGSLDLTGMLGGATVVDIDLSGAAGLRGVAGTNVRSIESTGAGQVRLSFEPGRSERMTVALNGTGAFELNAGGLNGITAKGSEHNQNQLIGSAGIDIFTGGRVTGGDFFTLYSSHFAAASAAQLAASADEFTNWGTGRDFIRYGDSALALFTAVTVDHATAMPGVARISQGYASFASEGTLAEKITWTEAAIQAGGPVAAYQTAVAAFLHGGDRYLFISNATAGINPGDALVRLVGVQTTVGLTLAHGGVLAGEAEQVG